MKTCTACLQNFVDDCFHKKWKWKLAAQCKFCVRKNNTPAKKLRKKEYDKNRKCLKKRRQQLLKANTRYLKRNPDIRVARNFVKWYFRKSKESRPKFSFVSWKESDIIELHHFDYQFPNKVIPCTQEEHKKFHSWLLKVKNKYILTLV